MTLRPAMVAEAVEGFAARLSRLTRLPHFAWAGLDARPLSAAARSAEDPDTAPCLLEAPRAIPAQPMGATVRAIRPMKLFIYP